MQGPLNTAISAARKAGDLIMRSQERLAHVSITEKQSNDFVSDIDIKAEQIIKEAITKAYPDHGILAEESPPQDGNEYTWIIDPLDGTTNYLHQFPHFAVSIALKHKNRIELGVIYDPVRGDLFTAQRGRGAQLNNRRIRVSEKINLHGALLGTGFPFKQKELLPLYLETFQLLFEHTAGIRRAGAAALDLAYVAAGKLDGFWEFGLQPWDMAAGILLIKEAGGMITDLHGAETYFESGNILAGNLKIVKAMLKTVHPAL